ncbi:MAG: prolyl oligopeptidase family serine peptidase [Planctomycetaceae bacterium]|nr:prolyl oligopeptidase family serine peptidase [Planctomycetaceae bacterium]
MSGLLLSGLLLAAAAGGLEPGEHTRELQVEGETRSYLVHVPPESVSPALPPGDSRKQQRTGWPVVLVFHGGHGNARMMQRFCGMNETADRSGFVAVYPNGTGNGRGLSFHAGLGGLLFRNKPDDVVFVEALLADLSRSIHIDSRRVYATGMSNGGMMSYHLARSLPERIAAIAPVAGTMPPDDRPLKRPVPLMHFHGTEDRLVPWDGPNNRTARYLRFLPVDETVGRWRKDNLTVDQLVEQKLPDTDGDGRHVYRTEWAAGENGAPVILYRIDGGGHTWPGRAPRLRLLGDSTLDIPANELIWQFFSQHQLPERPGQ